MNKKKVVQKNIFKSKNRLFLKKKLVTLVLLNTFKFLLLPFKKFTMKKTLFLFLSFSLFSLIGCSNDDDKADVNYITAKFNGTEERFTIISVDIVPYDGYSDIVVRATPNNDLTKVLTIGGEYGATGSDVIWGLSYETEDEYFEQYDTDLQSNITANAEGNFTGTFSGSLIEENSGNVLVITNGSFNIKY